MKPYYSTRTVTLYHADCRDQLVDLPSASVDLLLTDPPYGMAYEGKGKTSAAIRADGSRQGMRVLRQALSAASHALAPDAHGYVFCHWESWPDFYDAVSAHLRIKGALVWWKNRGGMGDCAGPPMPRTTRWCSTRLARSAGRWWASAWGPSSRAMRRCRRSSAATPPRSPSPY